MSVLSSVMGQRREMVKFSSFHPIHNIHSNSAALKIMDGKQTSLKMRDVRVWEWRERKRCMPKKVIKM